MKLNRTSSVWDRYERNKINENWESLDGLITSKGSSFFEQEIFEKWLNENNFKVNEPVETFNDLPKQASLKEIRGVLEENSVYIYDGEKWIKQSAINFDGLELLKQDSFYTEVEVNELKDRESNTVYWTIKIPFKDNTGREIKIKKGLSDSNDGETPREFFNRTGASVVVNASVFNKEGLIGRHIQDGKVIQDVNPLNNYVLGLTSDRTFNVYSPNVTSQEMLSDGVINSWTGFYPIISNSDVVFNDRIANSAIKNPRTMIGVDKDKNIWIIVTDGRKKNEEGMTYDDLRRISRSLYLTDSYCLDGGGSSQAVVNGGFVGGLIDDRLTSERKVYDFVYIKKETGKSLESSNKTLSELSTRVKKLENKSVFSDELDFDNKAYFNDYVYLKPSKAIYAKDDSVSARFLGFYDNGYIYLGDQNFPLSINSSQHITVVVDGVSHKMGLIPTYPKWNEPSLVNGWMSDSVRRAKYIKIQDKVTITGYLKSGKTGTSNPMFVLPAEYRPKQQIVVSVPVISGDKETNNLVIYPNGNVAVQYPFGMVNENAGVQIDVTYTTL